MEKLQPSGDGNGPLLQRDYWAVVDACTATPEEVIGVVRRQFCDLAPGNLVSFSRSDGSAEMMEEGEELALKIQMASSASVRVVAVRRFSITLATLQGHPEAGKITFGAYYNDKRDVVIHIRSRARSKSRADLVGFLLAGDAMQTNTWTEFIDRLAHVVGAGVIGAIQAEKREVEEVLDDDQSNMPTYIADGS